MANSPSTTRSNDPTSIEAASLADTSRAGVDLPGTGAVEDDGDASQFELERDAVRIQSYEDRLTAARDAADLDLIAEVQEEYTTERAKKVRKTRKKAKQNA